MDILNLLSESLAQLPYLSMIAKMHTESLVALVFLAPMVLALVKLEFSK